MIQTSRFSYLLFFFLIIPFVSHGQQGNKQLDNEQVTEAESKEITIYKKPNCHCCTKWASYLEEKGFTVDASPSDTLDAVKEHYLVPEELESCHTAVIDGYVVEGHVPAESINKLLEARPEVQGIVVPGMPTGTPGMGNDGTPFEVYLFDEEGNRSLYEKH